MFGVPAYTMGSTSPLGAIAAEETALNDYAAVRYTNIAFLMFMVFDHAITFDTEVDRIWTLKWRPPKVLFLINRYVVPPMLIFDGVAPVIYNLPESLCIFIAKWTSWPTIVSLATVEIILMIRVFAISGHRKTIRIFLVGLFICEMIAWITLSSVILTKTTGAPGGSLFPGCLFSAPKYFFAAWIPAVVFESTIILITVYYLSAYEWSKNVNSTLRILARDSMIYFLIMFSVLLANLFIARFGRDFLGSLLIAPSSVIACVGAARMMMNLREISAEDGPSASLDSDVIEFREPCYTTVGDGDVHHAV
ncbi:hypothetical protein DFH08DRAFT_865728 [Mycena albidolilacea]|uniref:DUF6533 domain-containing protein n=1 Tax=Mycena albidolilacea TaxID=1033008 RepID=A0AAD7A2K6_9AGAR|nr:hypothetical protein DFH08DRAFT_865728 [Mycena albidolilacea]